MLTERNSLIVSDHSHEVYVYASPNLSNLASATSHYVSVFILSKDGTVRLFDTYKENLEDVLKIVGELEDFVKRVYKIADFDRILISISDEDISHLIDFLSERLGEPMVGRVDRSGWYIASRFFTTNIFS